MQVLLSVADVSELTLNGRTNLSIFFFLWNHLKRMCDTLKNMEDSKVLAIVYNDKIIDYSLNIDGVLLLNKITNTENSVDATYGNRLEYTPVLLSK